MQRSVSMTIAEVDGLPFYAEEFDYTEKKDMDTINTTGSRSKPWTGKKIRSAVTYDIKLTLSGKYILDQIFAAANHPEFGQGKHTITIRRPGSGASSLQFRSASIADIDTWRKNGKKQAVVELTASSMIAFD